MQPPRAPCSGLHSVGVAPSAPTAVSGTCVTGFGLAVANTVTASAGAWSAVYLASATGFAVIAVAKTIAARAWTAVYLASDTVFAVIAVAKTITTYAGAWSAVNLASGAGFV